jgi:hypothetical protein
MGRAVEEMIKEGDGSAPGPREKDWEKQIIG